MSINLNNYEIYFIDYFDGNLSAQGENELMLFLDSYPELKKEFESFENINLEQEEIVFSKKSSIKKTEIKAFAFVKEENYENVFVAYFESDLNKKEMLEVEQFLALNPFLKEEFELHSKLQLPKQEIVFENKSQLRKRIAIVGWQLRAAVAAASIALLISAFWFLNENTEVSNKEMASISAAESKSVPLKNNVSLQIAEREIRFAVSETKISAQIEPKAKQIVSERTETGKAESINYLKVQGQEIALTGKIECAKLLTSKQDSDLFMASVNSSQKKTSLLAKVFSNNANKFTNAIKPSRIQSENSKVNDPALVKFLAGSVNIFNTITGSEVEQLKVYDGDGNLRNYKIETEVLSLNKSINSPGMP